MSLLTSEEMELFDREARVFTCFQAAIELSNPNEDARDPKKLRELLDFLSEEYEGARQELLDCMRSRIDTMR